MSQLQRITIHPNQQTHDQLHLTEEQCHYLRRVLRLKAGDRFIAIGTGSWHLAELTTDAAIAHLLDTIALQTELPRRVVSLIAMPKGNGMDEVVRQVTELGVAEIVPLISDRTLLQPSAQKLDRWQRIVREATEQAERQVVPIVHPPMPFLDALQTWSGGNAFPCLCEGRGSHPHLLTLLQTELPRFLGQPGETAIPLVLATGPEGGWTEAELEQAIAHGYRLVSLGLRVLRAVTAPLVALSLVGATLEGTASGATPPPGPIAPLGLL